LRAVIGDFPNQHGLGWVQNVRVASGADRFLADGAGFRIIIFVVPNVADAVVPEEKVSAEGIIIRSLDDDLAFDARRAGKDAARGTVFLSVGTLGRGGVRAKVRKKKFRHPNFLRAGGFVIAPGLSPVMAMREPLVVLTGIERRSQADLFQTVQTIRLICLGFGFRQRRQKHAGEDRNDRNHDQQFNESERRGRGRSARNRGAFQQ